MSLVLVIWERILAVYFEIEAEVIGNAVSPVTQGENKGRRDEQVAKNNTKSQLKFPKMVYSSLPCSSSSSMRTKWTNFLMWT